MARYKYRRRSTSGDIGDSIAQGCVAGSGCLYILAYLAIPVLIVWALVKYISS